MGAGRGRLGCRGTALTLTTLSCLRPPEFRWEGISRTLTLLPERARDCVGPLAFCSLGRLIALQGNGGWARTRAPRGGGGGGGVSLQHLYGCDARECAVGAEGRMDNCVKRMEGEQDLGRGRGGGAAQMRKRKRFEVLCPGGGGGGGGGSDLNGC